MDWKPPPTAPPAWHPDPSDPAKLRYWDGQRWTEHQAPRQLEVIVPPAPRADTRNWFKRNPAAGVAILTAIAIFAVPVVVQQTSAPTPDPATEACADFIIAAYDYQEGVSTRAEFRSTMQGVVRRAEGTTAEPLAREVLRETTSGTDAGLIEAMIQMRDPCNARIDAGLD